MTVFDSQQHGHIFYVALVWVNKKLHKFYALLSRLKVISFVPRDLMSEKSQIKRVEFYNGAHLFQISAAHK